MVLEGAGQDGGRTLAPALWWGRAMGTPGADTRLPTGRNFTPHEAPAGEKAPCRVCQALGG